MKLKIATIAAAMLLAPAVAMAEGDPAKGKKVFNKCKACHYVDKEKNKVGPHLKGVVGRKVAGVEGYKYSKAMKEFSEKVEVWDEETLKKYLKKPKDLVPKTKMTFAGLKKDEDIENVIHLMAERTPARHLMMARRLFWRPETPLRAGS